MEKTVLLPPLERHHHFRTELLSKNDSVSSLENRMVRVLLETTVADESRDSSIAWELKHSSGVTQAARLLAAKRGLDSEIAAMGALLHDIYAVVTGSYEDHAKRGGPIASQWLDEAGVTDTDARAKALLMVTEHSDKHVFSADPYTELGKDVDILDCFLYPGALDEYLLVKPLDKAKAYFYRAKNVWQELGIEIPAPFNLLDTYVPEAWLQHTEAITEAELDVKLKTLGLTDTPFAVTRIPSGSWLIHHVTADSGSRGASDIDEVKLGLDDFRSHTGTTVIWPALGKSQAADEVQIISLGIKRMEA